MITFQEATAMLQQKFAEFKIIPVVVPENVEKTLHIADILVENSLPAMEVTFRSESACAAIAAIRKRYPQMLLGAGTVLTVKDLHTAAGIGCDFAVAPGFNPKVVKEAIRINFPFVPGVCTPSEIEAALELGCRLLKFFPAEPAGGLTYLQAIAAPYKHLNLSFMPTGGLTVENAKSYLADKMISAVGGTWLSKAKDLKAAVVEAVQIKEKP